MKPFTLSKKEMELMLLLWDAGKPLARQEILERAASRECSWKPNSIHILLNALLEKEAVQVTGFSLNSHRLSRTFEPAVSKEEYGKMQIKLALEEARELTGIDPEKLIREVFADLK